MKAISTLFVLFSLSMQCYTLLIHVLKTERERERERERVKNYKRRCNQLYTTSLPLELFQNVIQILSKNSTTLEV
jgi:hypothetical protein